MYYANDRKLPKNQGFKLNNYSYPANFLTVSSKEQLETLGITWKEPPIQKFKNEKYYYNTVDSEGVVISTPKDLDRLKEQEIGRAKKAARAILAESDWMVLRAIDGTPIPEDWQSHRLAVRLTSNEAEAAIAATDFEGIQSLKVEWPESPEAKVRREAEEARIKKQQEEDAARESGGA